MNYKPEQLRGIAKQIADRDMSKDDPRNVAAHIICALAADQESIKQFIAYGDLSAGYYFIGPFTPEQLKDWLRHPKRHRIARAIQEKTASVITMNEPESF